MNIAIFLFCISTTTNARKRQREWFFSCVLSSNNGDNPSRHVHHVVLRVSDVLCVMQSCQQKTFFFSLFWSADACQDKPDWHFLKLQHFYKKILDKFASISFQSFNYLFSSFL
jgi:hypothetical protein